MLDLVSSLGSRDCSGVTRREVLQVGALGGLGWTLSSLLDLKARAASSGRTFVRPGKSVVMLFLTGGASQIETFDPKMDAPAGVRSVTGELATSLPGVTFGGTLQNLARLAQRLAVVRSFTHHESDHTRAVELVTRGSNPTEAGMGSVVARLRGANQGQPGIPTHVYLSANEVARQINKERLRLLTADGPGDLGSAYAPFDPRGDGPANENMKLSLPGARITDRRSLRRSLDRLSRALDRGDLMASLDKYEQQAYDLILGKAWEAFDLSTEDPKILGRYDTSHFTTGISADRSSTLGEQLLLARRLCEAGCGFVTIHNPGWDMHGGPRQYAMPDGMEGLGRPVDHAVSAFVEDVEQRGLSDDILFILTGEFGRTPKVKTNGGRDHWPRLSTLAFSGGGFRMGQVIGQSAPNAGEPAARPITLAHLYATVLHFLFDVPELRLLPDIPGGIARSLEASEPISELLL